MNFSSDNKLPRIPFGEEQIDQRLACFNSHYTSDLSIWLSVAPMSDKYPSMRSYEYFRNNHSEPNKNLKVKIFEDGKLAYDVTAKTIKEKKLL